MADITPVEGISSAKWAFWIGLIGALGVIIRFATALWELMKKMPIVSSIRKITVIEKKVSDLNESVNKNNEKLESLAAKQKEGFDRLHDTLNALIAGSQVKVNHEL